MNNSKSLMLAALFCLIGLMDATSQKETVILYNSEPSKVELGNDGEIQGFVGIVPGYMEGYTVVKEPLVSPDPEKDGDVVVQPIFTNKSTNAPYSILSTERILLEYKPGYATLNSATLNKLDNIAAKLKKDPNAKVLLSYSISQDDARQRTIANNRVDSAKTYLRIKGISEDRVSVDEIESTVMDDTISVNFMN